MKKKTVILFFVFVLTFVNVSNAQHWRFSEAAFSRYIEKYRLDDWDSSLIEGNPFLFDEEKQITVVTKEDKKYVFPKANYQISNDLLFYKDNDDLYEIFPDKVKFVMLEDGKRKRIFVPGAQFPVMSKHKFKFFEVFTDAPQFVYVLVGYKKKIVPKNLSQSYASDKSVEEQVFKLEKFVFIKTSEGFVKVSPKLKNIAKILGWDDSTYKKMKKIVRQKKWKLNRPEDLQKLMEYYYLTPEKK